MYMMHINSLAAQEDMCLCFDRQRCIWGNGVFGEKVCTLNMCPMNRHNWVCGRVSLRGEEAAFGLGTLVARPEHTHKRNTKA